MGQTLSKAFIFDFDGTLVDSEQAIYYCFQSITKLLAPERENFAKNILIGPPLRDTASKILGPNHQNLLNDFVNLFIKMHDEKVIQHTKPYPEVTNLLQILFSINIFMAIATNKRQKPTKKLINHFGWENFFKFIECSDSKSQIRDKDIIIQDILNHDDSFQEAYFVGDTVNDGLAANLNQLKFIKANYGYGREQDWTKINIYKTINSLDEMSTFFNIKKF